MYFLFYTSGVWLRPSLSPTMSSVLTVGLGPLSSTLQGFCPCYSPHLLPLLFPLASGCGPSSWVVATRKGLAGVRPKPLSSRSPSLGLLLGAPSLPSNPQAPITESGPGVHAFLTWSLRPATAPAAPSLLGPIPLLPHLSPLPLSPLSFRLKDYVQGCRDPQRISRGLAKASPFSISLSWPASGSSLSLIRSLIYGHRVRLPTMSSVLMVGLGPMSSTQQGSCPCYFPHLLPLLFPLASVCRPSSWVVVTRKGLAGVRPKPLSSRSPSLGLLLGAPSLPSTPQTSVSESGPGVLAFLTWSLRPATAPAAPSLLGPIPFSPPLSSFPLSPLLQVEGLCAGLS
jgi:hypothetical protein